MSMSPGGEWCSRSPWPPPPSDMGARAPRLDADPQRHLLAEVRHDAAVLESHGRRRSRRFETAQRALDPATLLGDERLGVAQGHAARQDDLDLTFGGDDDPGMPGAPRAPDAIVDLSGHGAEGTTALGGMRPAALSALEVTQVHGPAP